MGVGDERPRLVWHGVGGVVTVLGAAGRGQAVFLGGGAAGQPLGVLTTPATYGITATAIGAVATWAVFRAAVQRFMLANAAGSPGAINLLIRPEAECVREALKSRELDGYLYDRAHLRDRRSRLFERRRRIPRGHRGWRRSKRGKWGCPSWRFGKRGRPSQCLGNCGRPSQCLGNCGRLDARGCMVHGNSAGRLRRRDRRRPPNQQRPGVDGRWRVDEVYCHDLAADAGRAGPGQLLGLEQGSASYRTVGEATLLRESPNP